MRCKKHPEDLSGTVGVCATCLRERLFLLIVAQSQSQAQPRASVKPVEDRREADKLPPPLIFPRSVSPYNPHRKHDQRFYSTPQVRYTGGIDAETVPRKKKSKKFSFLSVFFWSRSKKSQSDLATSRDASSNVSSSSWFETILATRRKNRSRSTYPDRRPDRTEVRGMSPERTSCVVECDRSSGYSSDSSEKWKRTPVTAPASIIHRRKPSLGRNTSGLAFCLSPLVRASPSRNLNQKCYPPEMGYSGEVRVPVKPHLSAAASFCANRSRKLTDFGRLNSNR